MLAVPIRRADRTLGVLYFENNLSFHTFTPERVEMFKLLSAQMAVALENSILFEERERTQAGVSLLADASSVLAEMLDGKSVLKRATELAVPALAEWCAARNSGERRFPSGRVRAR